MSDRSVLSYRLFDIVFRLMTGEKLSIKKIANDYHVSVKTIRRDLFERLNSNMRVYSLERVGTDHVQLAKEGRPVLDYTSIDQFFHLIGLDNIIPEHQQRNVIQHIKAINKNHETKQIEIVRQDINHSRHHAEKFSLLQQYIAARQIIQIRYLYNQQILTYNLKPYRLLFDKSNIWYLTALHGDRIKNFCLEDIDHIAPYGDTFEHDNKIIDYLKEYTSVWQTQPDQTPQTARIFVSSVVAKYFKRQNHFPAQKIEQEDEQGNLTISTSFRFNLELFPIVRSWIPHVRIISPTTLQTTLENEIRHWLTDSD
jgi:predicted DNA-binding transcriptional regulator YafY